MTDHDPQPRWMEKPDQDGWWWVKRTGELPTIVWTGRGAGLEVLWYRDEEDAEWYGPLVPPKVFSEYPDSTNSICSAHQIAETGCPQCFPDPDKGGER